MGKMKEGIAQQPGEYAGSKKMIHQEDADQNKRRISPELPVFQGCITGQDILEHMGTVKRG